ncbi:hypothetical protein KSF59_20460 [Vibrio parahaemolyticus]|uniref:hypothetical protein n=1 Tax=Vibrio parahaemolyticus TaxID=670 RepID=UPI001F281BAE|nr:hypothetical protein [Vibrio parahaemolyticus]MCG0026249.1 hypothetical protein [Vibrio parahaemolyticus]
MKEQITNQDTVIEIGGISAEEVTQEIIETLTVHGADSEDHGQLETQISILGKDHTIYVTMNDEGQCEIDSDDDYGSDLRDAIDVYATKRGGDELDAVNVADDVLCDIQKRMGYFIKATEFDDSLKALDISQDEFCERMGISQQEAIKWKQTGKYPSWVKYVMKGILAIKRDEKTVVINGEDYLYVEDVFNISINGFSLSIFENQDSGEYLVALADTNLNVDEDTLVKSFETLDAIHAVTEDALEESNNNEFAAHRSVMKLLA